MNEDNIITIEDLTNMRKDVYENIYADYLKGVTATHLAIKYRCSTPLIFHVINQFKKKDKDLVQAEKSGDNS